MNQQAQEQLQVRYPSLPPPPWLQLLLAKPIVLQDPANVMQALPDGEQTSFLHPCAEMLFIDFHIVICLPAIQAIARFLIFADGLAKKKLLSKEGDCQRPHSWAFVLGVQDQDIFNCQGGFSGKLETPVLFANCHGSMASEAAAI